MTSSDLQNLTYTYDEVGNVKTILDVINSSQKQCFTYDDLNRLTKATTYQDATQGCTAQIGNGYYTQNYTYSSTTGNMTSKAALNYTYQETNPRRFFCLSLLDF